MTPDFSERGLILAPQGRDAKVAAAILVEADIGGDICVSIPALVDALGNGAGFCVVTEEALRRADLRLLVSWIEAQPEWSDFPFILLTNRGASSATLPPRVFFKFWETSVFSSDRFIRPRCSA